MCVCTLLFCLLVCALLLLSAPFCFCLHPFVSVSALFSVCTLFHFTYDDFSFRKEHIKSDFLSIHHYVSAHFYSVCLLVCPFASVHSLLFLSAPFYFCPFLSVPFASVQALLFLSVPFCFCLHPFVSVCALFSVCTLFHFTYDDFSSRKGHIKSDFLSIHHISLHTFILSSCPRPFVSVHALLFLSATFGFWLCPFLCLHSFSFYSP